MKSSKLILAKCKKFVNSNIISFYYFFLYANSNIQNLQQRTGSTLHLFQFYVINKRRIFEACRNSFLAQPSSRICFRSCISRN